MEVFQDNLGTKQPSTGAVAPLLRGHGGGRGGGPIRCDKPPAPGASQQDLSRVVCTACLGQCCSAN